PQVEFGANYVVGDLDLSILGPSNEAAFDQHTDIFMNPLDVPLELTCQPSDTAGSKLLQLLNQLPALGSQHTKKCRRRLKCQSVTRRLTSLPRPDETLAHLFERSVRILLNSNGRLLHFDLHRSISEKKSRTNVSTSLNSYGCSLSPT